MLHDNQYESEVTKQTNGKSRRQWATYKWHGGILFTNNASLRDAECVGFSEIDRHAEAIYRYHYPEHRNYGDATAIVPDELPDFDFLIGGFPCQAFSIAGKRLGFEDTRGTLFFEIARILREKRPSHFLLENVAGLLSHDDGNTFRTIVSTLIEIGYDLEWTVINSKDHGVPQNRERVFIIGHPRDRRCGEVFSLGDGDGESLAESNGAGNDIAHTITNGDKQRGSYIVEPAVIVGTLRTHKDGEGFREMKSNVAPALNARARQDGSQQGVVAVASCGRPVDGQNVQQLEPRSDGLTNTITSVEKDNLVLQKVVDGMQGQRVYDDDGIASAPRHCKDGGTNMDKYLVDSRIRRLTPRECEALQGLPPDYTALGRYGDEIREVADTNRYKGLGNAFTVNVIEAIITKMLERGCLK